MALLGMKPQFLHLVNDTTWHETLLKVEPPKSQSHPVPRGPADYPYNEKEHRANHQRIAWPGLPRAQRKSSGLAGDQKAIWVARLAQEFGPKNMGEFPLNFPLNQPQKGYPQKKKTHMDKPSSWSDNHLDDHMELGFFLQVKTELKSTTDGPPCGTPVSMPCIFLTRWQQKRNEATKEVQR